MPAQCRRAAQVERRAGAAKRHVQRLDAGTRREHLHRDMQCSVGARTSHRDLSRTLLGVVDELPQRLPRRRGRHRQQRRIGEHARHRRELRRFSRRPDDQTAGRPPAAPRARTASSAACSRPGLSARGLRIADQSTRSASAIVDDHRACSGSAPAPAPPGAPRGRLGRRPGKRYDHRDIAVGMDTFPPPRL